MTKFNKYLNENDLNPEDAEELIKKNCSQFLKEGVPLYRGYKFGTRKTFFEMTPRQDRKPLNTSKRLSDALDREFNKRFGWKPRTEGVFCTPDADEAHDYGEVYLVLPFDGYKYLWSPDITDVYISMGIIQTNYIRDNFPEAFTVKLNTQDFFKTMSDEAYDEFVKFFMDKYKYYDKSLRTNRYKEVMVKCKKYYMFSLRRYRIDGYDFLKGV
jgi:hypothetical protein